MAGGASGAAESDKLLAFLVVPFVAGASRVFYWRGGYNYAEHLIAILYLAAQTLLLLTLLYPLTLVVPKPLNDSFAVFSLVSGVACCSAPLPGWPQRC